MDKSSELDIKVLNMLDRLEELKKSLKNSFYLSRNSWKESQKSILINNGAQCYADISRSSKEEIIVLTLDLISKKESHDKINKELLLNEEFVFNKNTYDFWMSNFKKRIKEIKLYEKKEELYTLIETLLLADSSQEPLLLEKANKLLISENIDKF